MSSDVGPTGIQSLRFCKWLWILNWSKWILVVDIPTQILLTILLFIDNSLRCKLKVYIITHTKRNHLRQIDVCLFGFFFAKLVRQWKSKEWTKCELECLLIFITPIQNLKSHVKTWPLNECQYIKTHTKEKPSKMSNITFTILPFY